MRSSSVRIALFVALFAVAVLSAKQDRLVLRAQQIPGAFVTAPGAVVPLTVQAQTPGGAPVPDVTIIFNSPKSGPGGSFPDSTEDDPTIVRAQTDASGQATVNFETSDLPGLFLVTARTEGAVAGASFPFTTLAAPPAAAADPTDVKRAFEDKLRAEGETIGLTSRVHGPVLVPAGSIVSSALPEPPVLRVDPLVLDEDSWVLWIDDFIFADFPHAVRLVAAPAAASAASVLADARTYSTSWWPEVRLADGTIHSLAPPVDLELEVEEDDDQGQGPPSVAQGAEVPCGIIVSGPNMPAGQIDVVNYSRYLRGKGVRNLFRSVARQPNGRLGFVSVTEKGLEDLVARAKAAGCTKVYIGLFTHGVDEREGGGLFVRKEGAPNEIQQGRSSKTKTASKALSWDRVTEIFRGLGQVKLCGLVGACFSGAGLDWFQGIGFSGSLIATSNSAEVSYNGPNGHFVVKALLDALTANSSLTDQQALQQVLAGSGSPFTFPGTNINVDRIKTSMPQSTNVSPTGTRALHAPPIRIDAPGDTTPFILRRRSLIPQNQAVNFTLTIDNRSIAVGPRTVTLGAGSRSRQITFTGKDCGVTEYTLSTTVAGQRYEGKGVIQVGDFQPSAKSVTIVEGNTAKIDLELFGPSMMPTDRRVDASSSFALQVDKPAIAKVDKALLDVPNRAEKVSFTIEGLTVGKAKIRVFLLRTRAQKFIDVNVVQRDNRGAFLDLHQPFNRQATFTVVDERNPHRHPIELIRRFLGRMSYTQSGFAITGEPDEFVDLQGEERLDMMGLPTVPFIADLFGNSGNTRIAGFLNVTATATLTDPLEDVSQEELLADLVRVAQGGGDVGRTLMLTYTLGDGVFPGGPIEWDIQIDIEGSGGACGYAFDSAGAAVSSLGGGGSASLVAGDGCAWTATSDAAWLTLTSAASGSGAASITFEAAENPGPERTATITAAGATFTVTQDAADSPLPAVSAVVNGAAFAFGPASATWTTITGRNLAPTTRIWGDADFNGANLPTSLDGVSATINGIPAFVFFISPTQLNVLAPDDAFTGAVEVLVTTAAGTSRAFTAVRNDLSPALFEFDPEDRRYAAAVHADGTFLAKDGLFPTLATRAAKPGDSVLFFGTGFGTTTPAAPTSMLVSAAAPLERAVVVRIGGEVAEVQFAGLVGSGLYQFNVVVPDLPPGDHEVEIFIDGEPIQDDVFVTVVAE